MSLNDCSGIFCSVHFCYIILLNCCSVLVTVYIQILSVDLIKSAASWGTWIQDLFYIIAVCLHENLQTYCAALDCLLRAKGTIDYKIHMLSIIYSLINLFGDRIVFEKKGCWYIWCFTRHQHHSWACAFLHCSWICLTGHLWSSVTDSQILGHPFHLEEFG